VLGRRQLQRWLQILMYADADQSDSFMSPLLILATTRGRLMELMAQKTGSHDHLSSDTAFTVGIMSLINVLFDTPMVQLLAQISVSDDIKKALINRTGIYGDMLQLVIDLECVSDEEELPKAGMQKLQLQIDDLRTMQLQAYEFSNSIGMDVVEDQ
jgi:EAL and modified HD-GYP domain-containing signal transduction protein